MNNKEIFTKIYKTNKWGSKESVSGPGSTIKSNEKLIFELENFIKYFNIKSYLDIACGDFNWMNNFNFNLLDKYCGIDIVDELIKINNNKYSDDIICFRLLDISTNLINEQYDFVMCKDMLVHLSIEDIFKTLKNIKNTNSKFLALTTFYDKTYNKDIKTGTWRPLNFDIEPFNFKPFKKFINVENRNDKHKDKSIYIYELSKINI